jgi:hypothetical protein
MITGRSESSAGFLVVADKKMNDRYEAKKKSKLSEEK